MDKPTTIETVTRLVGDHAASLLAPEDVGQAVDNAAVPDAAGRLPGADDWVPTYEPYWAAAEAVTALAIRAAATPSLTKVTAEGATFERQAPSWWAAAEALRARSPLARAIRAATGGLGITHVEGETGYDTTAQTWPDATLSGAIGNWS